ncbi:MAG TPA: VCBS repeat-containing protein, partial [Vicinamibacterales bacterium]
MLGPPRLLAAASAALLLTLGFHAAPQADVVSRQRVSKTTPNDEKTARDMCTPCHKFPEPDVLPRKMWRSEIAKMMFIMQRQPQPSDLESVKLPDDFAAVDRYMEAHAPERLPAPEPWPDPSESPVKFTSYGLTVPDMPNDPAVSNVNLVDYDGDGKLDVLGTEMQLGIVFWGPLQPRSPLKVIANVPNPDHITLTDVDKDGIKDLLIADLGRFLPGD